MPTYVYRFVDTGETIEVQQSFDDPTLTETTHPVIGAKMQVKKVFQPVGVTFRGTGFYKTDSRGVEQHAGQELDDTPSSDGVQVGQVGSSSTSTSTPATSTSSTTSD